MSGAREPKPGSAPRGNLFERLAEAVEAIDAPRAVGRVVAARGGRARAEGLGLPVGGVAVVRRADGAAVEGEVMGVSGEGARLELLGPGEGVTAGAVVELGGRLPVARLSRSLLGRAVDALARPADGRGAFPGAVPVLLSRSLAGPGRVSRTILRGGTADERAARLAAAAAGHDGPVVALLVGGTASSHERFAKMLGGAVARTARVVEPGHPSRARAWRAARVAGALAGLLAEEEGGPSLIVADWRVPIATPAVLSVGGGAALWSFGSRARADADAFDGELWVDKREVA